MTPKRNGRRSRNGCSNGLDAEHLEPRRERRDGAHRRRASASVEPALEVRGDEGVVGQVGVLARRRGRSPRAWPGLSALVRVEAPVPSSRPWRRSTSWQPAMQPWKSLATSKNALLQSVTRLSSASSSASIAPPLARRAALQRSSSSTASRVHTDQWPSRPPRKRTVTGAPSRAHRERRHQVEHDVVVVAGVERDPVLGAGRDDAADDVERAIAVERRDLDRDDVVDARRSGSRSDAGRSTPPTAGCR